MDTDNNSQHGIGASYATYQLARALTRSSEQLDAAGRVHAEERIRKWTAVVLGRLSGKLDHGSCTPIEGTPAWATPEVVTGGFATGALLAGGPLKAHEIAEDSALRDVDAASVRMARNRHCLTEEGIAGLAQVLASGHYKVDVPEEGALLVVAWLVQNGHAEHARQLVDELLPHFSALRFYPIPSENFSRSGVHVCLETVAEVISHLDGIGENAALLAQKEALEVWRPLYDRLVGLFLETVVGETPRAARTDSGAWVQDVEGKYEIAGGWPCAHYPDGWAERARGLLAQVVHLRDAYKRCGRVEDKTDSFGALLGYLRSVVKDKDRLGGREVGRIRLILARYIAKHGLPGSDGLLVLRERQRQEVAAMLFRDIARVVVLRLMSHAPDDGLDDISSVVRPIDAGEALDAAIQTPVHLPPSLLRKAERCASGTIDALVERGFITSGDTLARLLPQITSESRARAFNDPSLRRLYSAIYRVFRRRRSLLLLDLQRQVQIDELPWIAAINGYRTQNVSARENSRQVLVEVASLAVASFPQAIVPNKLLQEFRALASAADLSLPLVEEVAADIFMGRFSPKFTAAAKLAANLLKGTLYARYFAIDYGLVLNLPEENGANPRQHLNGDAFAELCAARADVALGGWGAAKNGMIIEQQQILTTQNLAVLFDVLDLKRSFEGRLDELARRCFTWVCNRLQMRADRHHASLIQIKNSAYAWRQMIFFLALCSEAEILAFVSWAKNHLAAQPWEFQQRFSKVFRGLELVIAERDREIRHAQTGTAFLGWTTGRHVLMPADRQ